mgnify:FL=1
MSYFDRYNPIVAPVLGKIVFGILKNRIGLSFINPMQMIKFAPLPFRLNIQTPEELAGFPLLNFLLKSSHILRSIFSLFHKKSYGIFKALCGRIALNFRINHSSHIIPFWGFPKTKLFFIFKCRIFHMRFIHNIEQYFRLFKGTGSPHNIQNIRYL